METQQKLFPELFKDLNGIHKASNPAELFLSAVIHAKVLAKEPREHQTTIETELTHIIIAEQAKKGLYEHLEKEKMNTEQLLAYKHQSNSRDVMTSLRILFMRNVIMLLEHERTQQTLKKTLSETRSYLANNNLSSHNERP